MLRPRDGHDLRVLSSSLEIEPQPMRLRWIHDVFGNSVAIATFDERAETLSFTSTVDGGAQSGGRVRADRGRSRLFLSVPLRRRGISRPLAVHHAAIWRSQRRTVGLGAAISRRRRADADLQHPERHDPWHPRGVPLSQAPRAGHPASARHAADRLRHLPRLCAVHDRGAAPARHRRAFRLRLSLHSRRSRAWLCRWRLDACLGAGLSAERRVDRVRSDQRHRRQPRSDSGGGGARSASGDPAARQLSRFARRLRRHGGSHQRRLDRRGAARSAAAEKV